MAEGGDREDRTGGAPGRRTPHGSRRQGARSDGGRGAGDAKRAYGRGSAAAEGRGAARSRGPQRRSAEGRPRRDTPADPPVDQDVTGRELDRAVLAELRTLSKENAQRVAAHLVMVGNLLDVAPEAALAHADAAVRRAGRVAAVREARGMVAYRLGDFARALSEFRTARRLSGSAHLLPLLVDCERALGRPARALELAATAQTLDLEGRVELAIVLSGIRRDAGQFEAAAAELEIPPLRASARTPWAARLRYAYAEAQLALGDTEAARRWFAAAVEADEELRTDAGERLEQLDGIRYTDLLGESASDSDHVGGGTAEDGSSDEDGGHGQ